jgi:hypothetical protein
LEDGGSSDIARDAVVLRVTYTQEITVFQALVFRTPGVTSTMQLDPTPCRLTFVSFKTECKLNPA